MKKTGHAIIAAFAFMAVLPMVSNAEKVISEYWVEDDVEFLTQQQGAIFKLKPWFDEITGIVVGLSYEYLNKPTGTPLTGSLKQSDLPTDTATACNIAGFNQKVVLLEYVTPTGNVYVTYRIQSNQLKQLKSGTSGVYYAGTGETMQMDRSKIISVTNVGGVETIQEYSNTFVIHRNKRVTGFGDLQNINPQFPQYWQDTSGEDSPRVRVIRY